MPGYLILTAADAVTADKKTVGPQNYISHCICIYCVIPCAPDKKGGGENGGQAAAFMCLYIDMFHQRER